VEVTNTLALAALPSNFRLGWKRLKFTNTPALGAFAANNRLGWR